MLYCAHSMAGRNKGPAIMFWDGKVLSSAYLDRMFQGYLVEMFKENEIFPDEIKSEEDIIDHFFDI